MGYASMGFNSLGVKKLEPIREVKRASVDSISIND